MSSRSAMPGRTASNPVTPGLSESAVAKARQQTVYPNADRKASGGRDMFTFDGRRRVCVGTLRGGMFVKRVRPQHVLQRPPAIAIQDDVLAELRQTGCHTVEAILDGGKILHAPLARFIARGFAVNRQFGPQTALGLGHWDEDCGQGSLFGGEL